MFYGRRHNGGITPDLRYESVGRGFESLPSHQEKPVHIVCWFFFFFCLRDGRGSNRAAAHSAAGNQPSGLLLSPQVPTRRNVYRGSCKSKDFMDFLFFWQSLHTFAHLLHTLQKAMNSLHRLHSVYFAAQKREFYAKSTCVSSRRSSASICRMASRIILPVIFVATGVLFSGGSCGFAPATSCV